MHASHPWLDASVSRVAIVGNAGSGKSTLARAISIARGWPVLDLDHIFWERDVVASPRPAQAVHDDLQRFCATHAHWVIEGCYGDLVSCVLAQQPLLILLHPGLQTCLAQCRARPWEPDKYPDLQAQNEQLEKLLVWVSDYYSRDGVMSLQGHLALFEAYAGPKRLLTAVPALGA